MGTVLNVSQESNSSLFLCYCSCQLLCNALSFTAACCGFGHLLKSVMATAVRDVKAGVVLGGVTHPEPKLLPINWG